MKKIWARVGMTYEMSEKQYAEISDAIKNEDDEKIKDILERAHHYKNGETYLPAGADDNPNLVNDVDVYY